ncbi:MAG: sigma-54-dependent Fis family transcriptional regulator [Deltaproteobacteria bacterium]|nr:MAG: sigma-54-dependent Fis family transcriptional regulator [Deltaproteobacteria bacterium]
MPRLLVIDDRDQTIEMCHRHLPQFDYVTRCDRPHPCQVCDERDKGCPLKCAHDYFEAAQALGREGALPDLVVLDLHFALPEEKLLPKEKEGLELEQARRKQGLYILEKLRKDHPKLPVVMLTTTDADMGERPQDPLVHFCENEVVDSRTLAAEISRALTLQHEAQEGPVFWGRSPAMADLRRQLAVLSRSPLPVLIEGETGTGKSFFAEHVLHPRSGAKGPLVVTDLSTVPSTLMPAHLFGSRRGSYTGAVEDHAGVFEQAHGGTLFLDEIANLDLELQRQLLLVLERGTVTRLGDSRPRPAAPKLVAATNLDLEQLLREGRFRPDLYMRLNPSTRLRIPPLRERRQDLSELVRFAVLDALRSEQLRPLARAYLARFPTPEDFLEENCIVAFGKPQARSARRDAFSVFLSQSALARLAAHPWRGNHRELKLLVTNALVFALVQQLDAPERPRSERAPAVLAISDHLIDQLLGKTHAPGPVLCSKGAGGERRVEVSLKPAQSFAEISADVERQYLMALFHAHEGDLDGIAAELFGPGANRRKVHLRMNQLGLRLRALRGETA